MKKAAWRARGGCFCNCGDYLGRQSSNTCFGDLRIFGGLHARDADGAHVVTIKHDGHAAFEQAVDFRRAQERHAAAIDHLFIDARFAAAQRGRLGFGRRDMRGNRRHAIHAFASQLEGDSDAGLAPVLAPYVLERLLQPFEVVFL